MRHGLFLSIFYAECNTVAHLRLWLSVFMLWQVNQKMILTLTASIMYWSLQQPVEDMEASASPATASTITDRSTTSSINGEDESSSLCGEVLNLSLDDTASDTTVSSVVENERDLMWPTSHSVMMLWVSLRYIGVIDLKMNKKKANFLLLKVWLYTCLLK